MFRFFLPLSFAFFFALPIGSQELIALEPAQGGRNFAFQGEFQGGPLDTIQGIQVVSLGLNSFEAWLCKGALPGNPGFLPASARIRMTGTLAATGDTLRLTGGSYTLDVTTQTAVLRRTGGSANFQKVLRQSPTLGAAPAPGATILFNGTGTQAFTSGAVMDSRGFLAVPATTSAIYLSFALHVEFRIPFVPERRDEHRGNSGLLFGNFELQVLDSYGRQSTNLDCGAIYSQIIPSVNNTYPPLSWQTYDIDWQAPVFTPNTSTRTRNGVLTVIHNGVVVQNRVNPGMWGEFPCACYSGNPPTPARAGSDGRIRTNILFQEHSSPVYYRNIWIVSRPETTPILRIVPKVSRREALFVWARDVLGRWTEMRQGPGIGISD